MVEVDRRNRRGENERKPYGGNISKDPFIQELNRLRESRGFVSQLALARALIEEGQSPSKKQGTISNWFTGKHSPSPAEFTKLTRVLNPNEQELQTLVDLYRGRTGRSISLGDLIV